MHPTSRTVAVAAALTAVAGATAASAPASTNGRRVDGTVVLNRFGRSRVTIYVRRKRIVGVAYTLPTDRPRSASINAQAGPILRAEALRAQSARIHLVSGATYSTEAFAQSLQAAINRAHLR
jgi:uncharacterized protein with FMN-binding domain